MEPTEPADSLLTPKEVAERFGVSVTAVRRWAEDGRLPFVRTPGKHRRFRSSAVDALEATTHPESEVATS